MCTIIQGDDHGQSWRGHRSVEALAFDRGQRKVAILFLLLMENLKPRNYLRMLHPGNSSCRMVRAWTGDDIGTLPYHPWEDELAGNSVLDQIYHKLFRYRRASKELYQVRALNPFESIYGLKTPRKVVVWPHDDNAHWRPEEGLMDGMERFIGSDDEDAFVPFTAWRLGPFVQTGLVLVSFHLWFEAANFDQLVTDREYFSVDGPSRLMSRIKYDCIPVMAAGEQRGWRQDLTFFEDHIDFERNYDIVIHKIREADGSRVEVDKDGSHNIAEAAEDRQPRDAQVARRYVTMKSDFKLNLHFIKEPSGAERQAPDVVART